MLKERAKEGREETKKTREDQKEEDKTTHL